MAADESFSLYELQVEVEAELAEVQSFDAEQAQAQSPAEWLFDPTDIEREEVGLRGLLGAVQALESPLPDIRTKDREYPNDGEL